MQPPLLIALLLVAHAASYQILKCPLSRSPFALNSAVKGKFSNTNRTSLKCASSEMTGTDIISAASKTEQTTDIVPEIKKVEEWRDPVAVAAEGKSPLADIFPGGINGGNILGFFIYGYIGYLFLDSIRIMVMNYGVTPPPL